MHVLNKRKRNVLYSNNNKNNNNKKTESEYRRIDIKLIETIKKRNADMDLTSKV